MSQSRRQFLGILLGAGAFLATRGLVGKVLAEPSPILEPAEPKVLKIRQYSQSNMVECLKELYAQDKSYMRDLVYKENPFLALVPKDGLCGAYVTVPVIYGGELA